MIKLVLPWPISDNRYYLVNKTTGRKYLSSEGRNYREQAAWLMRSKVVGKTIKVPALLQVIAYPPDNRRRDLTNLFKCLCDALEYGQAVADDKLFDDVHITRGEAVSEGRVAVMISVIGQPDDQAADTEKE